MDYTLPEQVGISSKNILKLLKRFDDAGLNMHSVIISRYGKVFYEGYWEPFNEKVAHRLYSVTKSFVGIAIGFLIQDGLIDIDDKVLKYFPDIECCVEDTHFKNQTIRDMLVMQTAITGYDWFSETPIDRVKNYFQSSRNTRTPGTIFSYDSSGSFILGALIEKVSGKSFLEFMREKVFDKIDMSGNIECLKCPGGYSWVDSALIMPPLDLLKFAMFVMNKGKYKDKQILDESYVVEAISKQVDNNICGVNNDDTCGYGYQIWRTYDNSFAFMGMGSQYAICVPDKDLIFICTADNQGNAFAEKTIFDAFFELISRTASDEKLKADEISFNNLKLYTESLALTVAKGEEISNYADRINGKLFELADNPMGIKNIRIDFFDNMGIFKYTNKQGYKEIKFGIKENFYQQFPQEGYSDEYANIKKEGHTYKCAASGAWVEEKKLYIKVQIIDKYFGNLHIFVSFSKNDEICLYMHKNAEDFLEEYEGYAFAVTT